MKNYYTIETLFGLIIKSEKQLNESEKEKAVFIGKYKNDTDAYFGYMTNNGKFK